MKEKQKIQAVRAAKIFCLDGKPPLDDGLILYESQSRRILRAGKWKELRPSCEVLDFGSAWITPGIFNCHTHLELCSQQTLQPAPDFCSWARQLQNTPKVFSKEAIENILREIHDSGTAFVADFCSGDAAAMQTLLLESGLEYFLFLEYLGWRQPKPRPLWQKKTQAVSLAAHSLYGVSPQTATTLHRWTQNAKRPFAIHLSESVAEEIFFQTGKGDLAEMLRGKLIPRNAPAPGMSSLALASNLSLLGPQTLLIHCTHLRKEELELLKKSRAMPCLCPRSNAFTGTIISPAKMLLEADIPFCLGTDSLASNTDLDLWKEVIFLTRQIRPSLSQIFDWTIRNPVRFFRQENQLGSLSPGKKMIFSILPEELRNTLS